MFFAFLQATTQPQYNTTPVKIGCLVGMIIIVAIILIRRKRKKKTVKDEL